MWYHTFLTPAPPWNFVAAIAHFVNTERDAFGVQSALDVVRYERPGAAVHAGDEAIEVTLQIRYDGGALWDVAVSLSADDVTRACMRQRRGVAPLHSFAPQP